MKGKMLANKFNYKLIEFFSLDLRSLAFFRIALGLLIITNLWERCQDLKAHYTDFGVLPRSFLGLGGLDPWAWSIHFYSGETVFQILLFCLTFLAVCALLLGYRTQWAIIISWLLELSIINRNWLVNTGGDKELCIILFWSMFLPLGAYFSLDCTFNSSDKSIPKTFFSGATIAYTLQICFIYWFSWALKSDPIWRREGTAVYYALNIDYMATSFGHFLLNFPALLIFFNFATLTIELFGPFLLFIPFTTPFFRGVAVILFILLHTGFGLSLRLGVFPFISAIAWLPFIPSEFWQKLNPLTINLEEKFIKIIHRLSFLQSRPLIIQSSLIKNLITLYLIGGVLLWNLSTINPQLFGLPKYLIIINRSLGLDQYWGTFAPRPSIDDGWYIIPGKLKDGTEVDLFRDGEPVNWEKPKLISQLFSSMYWLKYMEQLLSQNNAPYRSYYAQYLCRNWNSQHQDLQQLESLEIYYMLERTLPNYQTPKIEKLFLLKQQC